MSRRAPLDIEELPERIRSIGNMLDTLAESVGVDEHLSEGGQLYSLADYLKVLADDLREHIDKLPTETSSAS